MDGSTCKPVNGIGGFKDGAEDNAGAADNTHSHAEAPPRRGAAPSGRDSAAQPRPGGGGAEESLAHDGFIYAKCKFCGSIVVRRNAPGGADSDNYYYHINSDDPPGIEPAPPFAERQGTVYYGASETHDRSAPSAPERQDKSAPEGPARYTLQETAKSDALAYGLKLEEKGCQGICIRHDTGACGQGRCKTCEVHKAGLCCKRYLLNSKNANMLERDGGDYRNLMGGYIMRRKAESGYDEGIKRKLDDEAAKANAYRDGVRKSIVGAADKSLTYEWQEYTLDDLVAMFGHIVRRPVRIEIQLLIYLFYNYRFSIDLDHAESRLRLPKFAINRYLRAYYGHTYSSLLAKIRNEHSKLLLRIPLLRIGEVGALVGYKTHHHYSLNFKRYEGISPKEYRQSVIGIHHIDP